MVFHLRINQRNDGNVITEAEGNQKVGNAVDRAEEINQCADNNHFSPFGRVFGFPKVIKCIKLSDDRFAQAAGKASEFFHKTGCVQVSTAEGGDVVFRIGCVLMRGVCHDAASL